MDDLNDARDRFIEAQSEVERLTKLMDQACDEIDLLRRMLIAVMPPRSVLQAARLHLDRPSPLAGWQIERLRKEARKRYATPAPPDPPTEPEPDDPVEEGAEP